MHNVTDSLILVLTAAAVTFLLRAIPFLIFSGGRQMPLRIKRVVGLLPAAAKRAEPRQFIGQFHTAADQRIADGKSLDLRIG